jgi:DNA-binding NarL/FixJ family response regulator
LAERMVHQLNGKSVSPDLQLLTNREMEVLQRIVNGERLVDIAEELHLSIKTVSTHKRRIQEKLNVVTTAALVRFGLEHQLGRDVLGSNVGDN